MRYSIVGQVMTFFGMVFLLLQLLIIANLMTIFPLDIWGALNHGLIGYPDAAVFFWLEIELTCICSLFASNMVFLMIRVLIRHKVDNSSDKNDRSSSAVASDSILSIKKYLQMFNSMWVPFIVSIFV
jgi:hypothetical protein